MTAYDLRLGTGAAGPAFFGLGVKQSLITLLVVDLMYVYHSSANRISSIIPPSRIEHVRYHRTCKSWTSGITHPAHYVEYG